MQIDVLSTYQPKYTLTNGQGVGNIVTYKC